MKASIFHEFGDAGVLSLEEVETPQPKPGHVVVKVLAAGVNRLDHYLREGSVTRDIALPHVLGADAAGEIAEIGAGVDGFSPGERVIVMPGFPTDPADFDFEPVNAAPSFTLPGLGVWGAYAQYISAPARFVVKDDTGLAPEEVATLPVVLATAVHAVRQVGQAAAGDRVLIQAGASGSGSMQVQVAKALGAQVATSVRGSEKADFARRLGADLVIDTRRDDLVTRVKDWTGGRGADLVVDNLGGDVLASSIDTAKAGGVIVAYGFAAGADVRFDIRSLFFQQKQLRGSMASEPSDLEWGLARVRDGLVLPLLDRALPLEAAAEAHRLIAAGEVKGNLVLLPWAA